MKNKSFKKYIIIFLAVLIGVFGIGYALLNNYYNELKIERENLENTLISATKESETEAETETEKIEENVKDISVFVMGTDGSGYLTDTMLIVNADFNTDTVSMFSVPRDYKIELSPKVKELIGCYAPQIKLTELHSYAKMADYKSPPSVTASVTEELLGIKFDYIVTVNLKAFREAVDAIGGVELYLPRDYDYDDPRQDLSIHLKQGRQLLDGKTAEKVVRFRQSNDGNHVTDFNRIEMQQYFVKEFIKKFISIENTLNLPEIFTVIKDNIKTDATLNDVLYMATQANKLSMERVYAHTLPGEDGFINNVYYYIPPSIEELHKQIRQDIQTDRTPTLTSRNFDIIIINDSTKDNIAKKYKKLLEKDGYNVIKTDSINQKEFLKAIKTRIVVPKETLGKDLQNYFPLSEIIYDKNATNITITIGKLVEE